MIPYNAKKDLETNYYNKTEVELLVAGGGGSSSWDTISNKPTTIGGYGITDAYTKTEIGAINTDYVAVFNAALV